MEKLLLRKKNIIFIIFALLVLVAGFLGLRYGNNKKSGLSADKNNIIKEDLSSKDTDGDGLKDWEEALWKTDPNNPDTDGDGTSDGDEVKANRDPLILGPNDQLSPQDADGGKVKELVISQSTPVNLTLEIARNMGTNVTKGSQDMSKIDFSDPSSLSFLNKDMSENLALFIASLNPKVSGKEIKVSATNDEATVREYLIAMYKIILSPDYPKGDEGAIIDKAMQTGNFMEIDKYINYYSQAISQMKSMTVPPDFLALHKRGLELMMINKKIYESVKEVKTDALKTVIALEQFAKTRKETAELLSNFADMAKKYSDKYNI